MMTTWQLRKKYSIKTPAFRDSYQPVDRVDKVFAPMVVPKSLAEALPLKTKEKTQTLSIKQTLQKEERSLLKPLASDQEKKAIYLVQRLKLIEKEKMKKKQETFLDKRKKKEQWEAGMNKDRTLAKKKLRKEKFVKQGIKEKRKRERED